MTERYAQAVENVPAGKAKLFFITNHDDASEISPVKQFPGSNATISAFLLATALDGSSLIYSSQEIGYPSTLNFFENAVLDWDSNWSYTSKFKDAMQVLIHFHRGKGFKSYVSGSTIWIIFEDGYLAVNTTGNTVKVEIPPEIPREADKSKRKDFIVLDPYDFDITGCPTDI